MEQGRSRFLHNSKDEEEVNLWVFECFDDLVFLQMFIFDSSLVFAEAFDGPASLFWGEKFCCDGRIWEEEEKDDSC